MPITCQRSTPTDNDGINRNIVKCPVRYKAIASAGNVAKSCNGLKQAIKSRLTIQGIHTDSDINI